MSQPEYDRCLVTPEGIYYQGCRYIAPELRYPQYIGSYVLVVRHINQPSRILVFSGSKAFICVASLAPMSPQRMGRTLPKTTVELIHESLIEGHEELKQRAKTSDPQKLTGFIEASLPCRRKKP